MFPQYVEVVEPVVCADVAHLEKFFQDVIDAGGEGVILRDPGAPFKHGRDPGYLKHKVFPSLPFPSLPFPSLPPPPKQIFLRRLRLIEISRCGSANCKSGWYPPMGM